MPDMLVSLLNLPDDSDQVKALQKEGINIRRAQPFEVTPIRQFVREKFGDWWADEVLTAFTHQPVTCYVATRDKKIVGFAAYECTRRNFFGPTGVEEAHRGKGVGNCLLLACLRAMYDMGYAYGIIGGAGPVDFYARRCGAIVIPESDPGVYVDLLER